MAVNLLGVPLASGVGPQVQITAHAIVGFDERADVEAVLHRANARPVRELFPSRRMWLVADVMGRRDGAALANALSGAPGVAFAEADLLVPRTLAGIPVPPNDPSYPGQWYLKRIGIEGAWALSTGAPSVTIQVIDNGCDQAHPDLAAHILPGRDVIDGDDDPSVTESGQGSGHGTACAGIVGAVGNNAEGIAGTCPECKVRCVRMLDMNGASVPISADVEAMRFALLHDDVAVVSNSWAFTTALPVPTSLKLAIEDVSRNARGGKGALVVFAAGNENRELMAGELYSIPEVVTVGAINIFDEAAPFSNHGAEVDLTAPTGSLTLDPTGDAGDNPTNYTSLFGGTSAACPVVAGVAGLMFAAKPDATAAEVRQALVASARRAPFATPDQHGHDDLYGYGIVDPRAAIERLLGIVPDAGTDAGQAADAGSDAGMGPLDPPRGCGCSAGAEAFALAALTWLCRRARAGRRTPAR
ncbi:MAG: S8 family serine peptidase [Archangiaceae bacterium]|nr:S8 family serine peptidase [Archangiaceae bacterium]